MMRLADHADNTFKELGIRAEDIHKWIDGLFDEDSFALFLSHGQQDGYNPYDHRQYRHCREALQDVLEEFRHKYTPDQIKAVFESHIRDDYNGYIPTRTDFEKGTFKEEYHEDESRFSRETILTQGELKQYFKGESYNRKTINNEGRLGFQLKIVLPTLFAILLFVSTFFVFILPIFRENLLDSKKLMIRELCASAASAIEYYADQVDLKQLDLLQAQEMAAAEISKMRYGKDAKDYFWITDMWPRMVMHPYRSELNGQDLRDYKDVQDKSGKALFVEFSKMVANHNEGYLKYQWQLNDDPNSSAPKLSYVRGIPRWGWIVGTGIYINDIEDEISSLTNRLLLVFTAITAGLVLFLINIVLQSGKIENDRRRANEGLLEARNRYRTLVESASEGYILETGGRIVFSNRTLQQMFEYTEEEFTNIKLWELLPASLRHADEASLHLKRLFSGKTEPAEFETQLISRSGKVLDVLLITSNIFLSGKNAHIICVRPILRQDPDLLSRRFETPLQSSMSDIGDTKVGQICNRLPESKLISHLTNVIYECDTVMQAQIKLQNIDHANACLKVLNKTDQIIGSISFREIACLKSGAITQLLNEVSTSNSDAHILQCLNSLSILLKEMSGKNTDPQLTRDTIAAAFHASLSSYVRLAIENLGKPPVEFALLTLGSNARNEMTMFSDQDNALVYADPAVDKLELVQEYFNTLAAEVCSRLDHAGYPFCPGGIMAANPKWNQSLSAWKDTLGQKILNPDDSAVQELAVLLDMRKAYGSDFLAETLLSEILKLSAEHDQFITMLARSALSYKVPLNLFGHLKAERKDGKRIFNLKENLRPLENFAKIYALKHRLRECGTLDRLRQLKTLDELSEQSLNEMSYAFNHLWKMRFDNQLKDFADLKRIDDNVDLAEFNDLEKSILQNILSRIAVFQTKLSYDFLGVSHI
jgi:PAS domain S-box-containing protein